MFEAIGGKRQHPSDLIVPGGVKWSFPRDMAEKDAKRAQ